MSPLTSILAARSEKLLELFGAHLTRRYGRPIPVVRGEEGLRGVLDAAPAALLTGEEPLEELRRWAQAASCNVEFEGFAGEQGVLVLTAERLARTAPGGFSVRAFMTTYNEADIVRASVEHLLADEIQVVLVDNWSDDGTWEIAQELARESGVTVERFPAGGPSGFFELRRLLGRIEERSGQAKADWFVHVDADELRASPWPSSRLRDALYAVDRSGFTAVDHTVLVFPPTDDSYAPGMDPEEHFRFVEFGCNPGHWRQVKAWKRTGGSVALASSGGHVAEFEGRRIFPYNFLTRHYPIRTQAHGERKVLVERQGRWSSEERADGWHVQYDSVGPGHCFLRSPETLEEFELPKFLERHLVGCLGRIGICGQAEPPASV